MLFKDIMLRKHLKDIHNEKRRFDCQYCGKNFSGNYRLKEHVEVSHLKIKNYG